MPRTARSYAPRTVVHIISRFANDEFRLVGPRERADLFARVARAQGFTDVTLIGHAAMSTHVHWTAVTGEEPISPFFASLNTGLAMSLNRRQGRSGPVFAGRFKCIEIDGESAVGLIAYQHNNTVRAGLVDDPADSDWTSHLAYLRQVESPPWLDVSLGLHLCGFSDTPSGRLAFHELVVSRKDDPRNPEWSRESRGTVRVAAAGPAGIVDGPAELAAAERESRQGSRRPQCVEPVWGGAPGTVADLVAAACGVTLEVLQSPSRRGDTVRARRLALWLWTQHLGRPAIEMASVLGLAPSTASYLLRHDPRRTAELEAQAAVLAKRLRGRDAA